MLDSISGLSPIGEDQDVFCRTLLDFIRLLNDEFGATALFTAEESEPDPTQEGVKTVAASDAVGHFHLDPGAHEQCEISRLKPLFDDAVDLTE